MGGSIFFESTTNLWKKIRDETNFNPIHIPCQASNRGGSKLIKILIVLVVGDCEAEGLPGFYV